MKLTIKAAIICLCCAMIVPLSVQAAAWQPQKPITVLVGFGAGGGVDTLARVFTAKMAENTGWNFAVVNKPGGGGSVMAKTLKGEKPDGYTIGFAPGENYTFNPALNPQIGFAFDDFTHLAAISVSQAAMVSLAAKPWNSFMDVIEAARSGQSISVAYQAPKMGMSMKAIAKVFGVNFKLIPVESGNDGMASVLGGHVDIAWGAGIQSKYLKAGTMKALASCEKERVAMAPEAPTIQELGVKFVALDAKFQFSGPKNMPKDVAEAYIRELKKASESTEIQDLISTKLDLKTIFEAGEELERSIQQSAVEAKELIEFVKD